MLVALFTVNPERVTALVTNILAVGGGYLAGFVGVGVTAYFLDRRLTGGKSPEGMHKVVRQIGGVIGALLVAVIVFGSGGDGGGSGDGTGTADQPNAGTGTGTGGGTTPTTDPRQPPIVTPPPAPVPAEDAVVVTVLSGADVRDAKFYVVDADRTPRTLDEVKDQVATRLRANPKGGVAIAIRLAPRTDRYNSGVRSLETWAREALMPVIILPPAGE